MPSEIRTEADLATIEKPRTGETGPTWPEPLKSEAYCGVVGELVRMIEPHSEADPAAMVVQTLVAVGNVIGRGAHFVAEADQHYTSLFAVVVGQTAKGRKGTSWNQVLRVLQGVDATWVDSRVTSGLASGEGLIHPLSSEALDKRLMIVETEFSRVLHVCERDGNTLSAIIRQAWDTGTLRVMTRRDPLHVTGAHISIIGHITRDELRRLLTNTAAGNGFGNRMLWVCARRSKLLPDGGAFETVDLAPVIRRIQECVKFGSTAGQLRRDEGAREIWHAVYAELSAGRPGLFGAVTSRAEAQTMRIATLYAVLDCSPVIRVEHLRAALAIWQYCEASARFIFGMALGDAAADEILGALRARPEGMTRTEIREHFSRNKSSAEVGRALIMLAENGLARMERHADGQGRPPERWRAVG